VSIEFNQWELRRRRGAARWGAEAEAGGEGGTAMSVYLPNYTYKGKQKRQKKYRYDFWFDGHHYNEPTGETSKQRAQAAEKTKRIELLNAKNGIVTPSRENNIRTIAAIAEVYLADYKLRHDAYTFAEYAVGHVVRILGKRLKASIDERSVKDYQNSRINEGASPKSINEEVGFLLRMLEDHGDMLRATMKRRRTLKLEVGPSVARAFTEAEKAAMLTEAKRRMRHPNGSRNTYTALVLALHAGLRDKECRTLSWGDINLSEALLINRKKSKTKASTGREVTLNADALEALDDHARWYKERFGEIRPEWYVFPWGSPQPCDPTRHQTSFKTAWLGIKKACNITARWHDGRHTWRTDLGKSNASPSTIMDMGGWSTQEMMRHYNHLSREEKRKAVATLERNRSKENPKGEAPLEAR
jgi:integrase